MLRRTPVIVLLGLLLLTAACTNKKVQNPLANLVRAGAEILVAGNAVFGQGDPKVNAQKLLKTAIEATLQKV